MNTPRCLASLAGAFLLVAVLATASFGQAAPSQNRVYVQFQPGAKAAARAAVNAAGGRIHHEFDSLDALAVTVPAVALNGLTRNPNVVLIEEDPTRELFAQTVPYGIEMVQAPLAVAAGATGAGVKVGVIDSGVYAAHADFAGVTITGEPDFGAADQRTWYRDIDSHGTHVTGTIAAANNSIGVVGVSPGDVAIHMVKVFGDLGQWVYSSDLLAAVQAAVAKNCQVINMSLGGGRPSKTEERGLNSIYNGGHVLLIAAAGNDGNTTTSYPAGYASVVSVAAIDATKAVASFSQQNATVELAAPGVSVLSTTSYIDETSITVGGNAYAAIHVEFAARGTATGALVYGGLGDTTNAAWAGKVVLVDRGSNTFSEKVHNVELSGGVACIIANNTTGDLHATLGEGNSSTIPAVGVTQATGTTLKTFAGASATVSTILTQPASGYDYFDGTSMATPHVSGVAALLWSKYPQATNAQLRMALQATAEDLGPAGRDNAYGYGLVQAKAALDYLAGQGGGSDTVPPTIDDVASTITNAKSGAFAISWTTDEPATGSVTVEGLGTKTTPLGTTHSVAFKGRKGAMYLYSISATDAAGNTATAGPFTHQN